MLGEPLDLSDLLMADNREYRALWARHYLGLEPPYELAQAVNVWRNSSSRAALKAADAAGEALSLLPQGANAADTAYQEALRAKLKSGRGVYGGTWLVNDTQILVPSVAPVGQKQSVTISCVALGGFSDRIKNLPETLSEDALRDSGFKPERGRLYTAEQSGQGELTGLRLTLLRDELIDPRPLAHAAKEVIQNPLEPPAAGTVFPPLDRALTSAIPKHLIDPRICEWEGGTIKFRYAPSVMGSPLQRRLEAAKHSCLYVNHDIDSKSLDPEKVAIFIWETLPLCVPDIEERDFTTQVPVMGCGIKGDRKLAPFTIMSMREPDRFQHAVHLALGRSKTFLHYVVGAPWSIPAWRAVGLENIFLKKEGEFHFEPLASLMEEAIADPRVDLYGPVSSWRDVYGGPKEPTTQVSQQDVGETKRYLLDTDPKDLPKKLQATQAYLSARLLSTADTMQNALGLAFELRKSISKTRLKENEFTPVPIAMIEHRRRANTPREPDSVAQPIPLQTALDI